MNRKISSFKIKSGPRHSHDPPSHIHGINVCANCVILSITQEQKKRSYSPSFILKTQSCF